MTAQAILDLRTRKLTDDYIISRGRDYVLCWLMQALRADENPVLDAAIALGNDRDLPVVVVHTLDDAYPWASHRLHRFILEASQELEGGVEKRGLRFARYVRREGGAASVEVAARLAERAAAVVVDDVPTFVTREYADAVAGQLDRAVLAVDACCAVPMNAFETHLKTTKAFRAAHTDLREVHLGTDLRQEPTAPPFDGDLDLEHEPLDGDPGSSPGQALDDIVEACGVDMTVPPAPGWAGRRSAALDQLGHAVGNVVPRYKWTRNNPALDDATAAISPWMHFGVLSPREVARAVLDAEAAGDVHPAARWKFLDETLTWREYYHHRCRHEPDWAGWSGLPDAARETLEAHADDPRPALYSLGELARGETDGRDVERRPEAVFAGRLDEQQPADVLGKADPVVARDAAGRLGRGVLPQRPLQPRRPRRLDVRRPPLGLRRRQAVGPRAAGLWPGRVEVGPRPPQARRRARVAGRAGGARADPPRPAR